MFVDAHIIILYASEGYMTEELRSVSDQIPFGVLSDSVRSPIRLRTAPDQIPYGARSDSVRRPIRFRTGSDENL